MTPERTVVPKAQAEEFAHRLRAHTTESLQGKAVSPAHPVAWVDLTQPIQPDGAIYVALFLLHPVVAPAFGSTASLPDIMKQLGRLVADLPLAPYGPTTGSDPSGVYPFPDEAADALGDVVRRACLLPEYDQPLLTILPQQARTSRPTVIALAAVTPHLDPEDVAQRWDQWIAQVGFDPDKRLTPDRIRRLDT